MTRHDLATLGAHLSGDRERNGTVLRSLQARYEEPWRHYHDAEHPVEMLATLVDHPDLVADVDVVVWAIAFHDAVYDPRAASGRNEELSALLAESQLAGVVDERTAHRVAELVRATAEHDAPADDRDLAVFLDLDLVILGSADARYDRYAADVRREYAHVPADDFASGRTAVLEGLARRGGTGGLFSTAALHERFESRAQANVAREIASLRS